MKNIFNGIVAAIGGILGYVFGDLDGFLIALLAFVVMDYLTGVIGAAIKGKLSSSVGFIGIAKKVLLFAVVGVANILDQNMLSNGQVLRDIAVFFYIANEGISILENVEEIGMPLPKFIKDILNQLLKKGEDK